MFRVLDASTSTTQLLEALQKDDVLIKDELGTAVLRRKDTTVEVVLEDEESEPDVDPWRCWYRCPICCFQDILDLMGNMRVYQQLTEAWDFVRHSSEWSPQIERLFDEHSDYLSREKASELIGLTWWVES